MNSLFSISDEHIHVRKIRNILKEYVVKGHVIPPDKHRRCDCLVYVFGGNAVYAFSTHRVRVTEGDILFIAKGSSYEYDILSETYDYIYLDFDFDYPADVEAKSHCVSMKTEKNACYYLFDRMYKLWLLRTAGYYEQCMSDFYQIYSKMIQVENAPYANSASRNVSARAAMYIAQNCTDREFQISQVAREVACSDVHLRRIFKRDFGITPVAYSTKVRLDKARSLLDNTQYSITMIADMTGFKDAYYFSRIFKQNLGCTPTEYRSRK